MIISTTNKIELTDRENLIVRKAAKIIATLSESLGDCYYGDLADRVEEVCFHEPWEIEIEAVEIEEIEEDE